MSRVWGRHAPTRSLRKCRRIVEVKSRMDRKFSRIENLWPRDGSCPLPLRSKSFPGNCFRIVKAQKISRGGSAHVMGIAVCSERSSCPCLCSGVGYKAGITSSRLMKFSRCSSIKEKYRPRSTGEGFCRVNRRQNESGVLRSGKFFRGLFLTEVVGLTVITNHFLWLCSK